MAALTRLVLTQRLGRWSGTKAPSEITSTTSPDDDHVADLVAFVDQAWEDIQTAQGDRWLWMRERSIDTVALSASTATLALSAIDSTCRAVIPFYAADTYPERYVLLKHPTSEAIHKCSYVPYDDWRGWYDRGTRTEGRPVRYTVRPDGTLEFDPTPDVAYTINCDWVHEPVVFSADANTPDMPNHFHMLIVWWAMVYLMGYDENSQHYQIADRQLQKMYNRLCVEQIARGTVDEFLSTTDVYLG